MNALLIARWGVGYDRIDFESVHCRGRDRVHHADSIRRPVAEGILALMFALAKTFPPSTAVAAQEAGGTTLHEVSTLKAGRSAR